MIKKLLIISAVTFSLLVMAFNYAEASIPAADNSYVGVKTCGMCHKKEADGNQLAKWEASKHSKAFEALASDAAKKIAKEKGIADAQKAEECLACHASGYQADAKVEKKFKVEDGVQCETCHGPGSEYKSMKTMKDHAAAVAAGLTDFSKEGAIEAQCRKCHNEKSPTFKGFDFAKQWAEIAHNVPKG